MAFPAAEVPSMAQTYDLDIVQGQRFRRGFQWVVSGTPRPLSGHTWRAQARQKEALTAPLILDLASYLTLDDAATTLWLDIPARVTAELDSKKVRAGSCWDIFLWPIGAPDDAFLFLQGAITVDQSATDMRGGSSG